ncbi:MAG: OmpA family protein [Lewinellaceae bacterium]|nr:OmpA family protein [Saprospiraceae bacterium]MCB9337291.1 OmpA family protein [Lewinellaceae bacterium]
MLRRTPILLLLPWFFYPMLAAQEGNLVLNPGFESMKPGSNFPICSYSPNSDVFNQSVAEWNTFGGMTPDLIIWQADAYGDCFFPTPHSGEKAIGFINYLPASDLGKFYDFHECVQGKLRFPLVPGQAYKVGFYIQQSNSTATHHLSMLYGEKQTIIPTASGNLGILFSYNPTSYIESGEMNPQILFKEPIVTRQGEWLLLETTFVPDRSFLYFTIGNFFRANRTPTTIENNEDITAFNLSQSGFVEKKKRVSYYLIDDITVMPAERPGPTATKAIAKNLIEKKSYTFENVNFETAKWDLLPEALPELDGLARFLKVTPNMKVEIGGHTDNMGSDEDNLVLSEKRAAAVYQYLLGKGIDKDRLSFKGYGETVPVASNGTATGRLQNRRVECRVR